MKTQLLSIMIACAGCASATPLKPVTTAQIFMLVTDNPPVIAPPEPTAHDLHIVSLRCVEPFATETCQAIPADPASPAPIRRVAPPDTFEFDLSGR